MIKKLIDMNEKKSDKLEKILEKGLNVFARYGFKKTTVEDVASELGMTKGNLYLYVKNKKDLYEKTVAHAMRGWQAMVASEMSGEDDVVKQFEIMARRAFEFLSENNELRTILMNDPSIFPLSPNEDRFPEINKASLEILKGVLKKGIKERRFRPMDIDSTAEFIFSVYVMFIIKTYVKTEGNTTENLFSEGLKIIIKGILKH